MAKRIKRSPELADEICKRMSAGESLRQVCRSEGMPSRTFVTDWLREDKNFADQYTRAREDLLEHWADQIVDIADDSERDWETRRRENGEEYEVANPEMVNRARLRVDTRKWLMSKLAPRKYGDKVEHTGPGGGAIVVEIVKFAADQTPS